MSDTDTGRDEAQWNEIADWLRRRDPAKAAPSGLSGRRRERLVWLMERPFLAFLARHHRATALCCAVLATVAVAAVLFAVRAREQTVLPPVDVVFSDPDSDAGVPELVRDAEPPDFPADPPPTPESLLR